VRNATWHMLITSFAKLRGETERIQSYIAKASELQVLALAPLLVAFALLGPSLFPSVMGDKWTPVVRLFPFLAAGALASSLVTPTAAAMYACGADLVVFWIRLLQVVIVAITTWIVIPRIGLEGYGLGEATVLASALLFPLLSKRAIGTTRGNVAWIWLGASVVVIFWQRLGPWVGLAPALALLYPRSRQALSAHIAMATRELRGLLSRRA
jgi:O-antigen/teichoic acid export membrane protein